MILVLLNYSISCQANDYTILPLRGSENEDTTKVLIDLKLIKSANIKMIERKYLLEEMIIKDSIIHSYKTLTDIQNKEIEEYKIGYDKINKFNIDLSRENTKINNSLNNYKSSTVVLGGITLAISLTLVLFFVLN